MELISKRTYVFAKVHTNTTYMRWNSRKIQYFISAETIYKKKMRQYCLLKNMMKKGEQQRSRSKD